MICGLEAGVASVGNCAAIARVEESCNGANEMRPRPCSLRIANEFSEITRKPEE